MRNTGKKFLLENDEEILKINSPKDKISGPYKVVYKNIEERWVIVAFDWENKPRLGMRWFWSSGGSPISSGHGIWFVIPLSLSMSILSGLPINHSFRCKIGDFLCGKLQGKELIEASS